MPQILFSDLKPDGTIDYWRVESLWKASESLPITSVKIADFPDMDDVLWFGGPKDIQPTCREVTKHAQQIQNAELSYPIILSVEGEIWDGMHRMASATLQGITELPAVQFTENPKPDGTFKEGNPPDFSKLPKIKT